MDSGFTLMWRKVRNNPVLAQRGKRLSKLDLRLAIYMPIDVNS